MNNEFYKLGIIGYPLEHSISPVIQNEALKSVNLSGSYEKFEVPIEKLDEQINYFIENNFKGFNITIPYKLQIKKYLNSIDASAQRIGAVNTVKIHDGKLSGFNTDIYGFVNAIPKNIKSLKTFKNAKILGCGGAALAVVFGLEQLGCQNLTICARNLEKTKAFVNEIENKANINFSIEELNNQKTLSDIDILVNATPLGTKGSFENQSSINKELLKTASKDIFIYDLVYNPQKTLLINMAKELKLNCINGLDMLILQGAKAFEIWTGIYPTVETMKNAVSI